MDNFVIDKKIIKELELHYLLYKFTIENGWNDEFWKDSKKLKYYISFNKNNFIIRNTKTTENISNVYFATEEIAEKAINDIIIKFMYDDYISNCEEN